MSEISNLAYLGIGASDLPAWKAFGEDALGMQAGVQADDYLTLRMDEFPIRFFFERSNIDDLIVAGWAFDTEDGLEQFVADGLSKGAKIVELSQEVLAKRRIRKGYAVADPNGYTHELCVGFDQVPLSTPFRSKVLKGSFVTGDLGLGHFLPISKNGAETITFYREILKLRVSDYIRVDLGGGMAINANFFHTRTGRHHSIATAEAPAPKILNHIMVEVEDMDDVGLAFDRCKRAGLHISGELGHHPNDDMFSFYVRSPSGFNIEYGWGGRVIDDANWQVITYSEMSDWGHKGLPGR
jgi:2,3-dihydroxybiphenyl 1,2-dioxygenase